MKKLLSKSKLKKFFNRFNGINGWKNGLGSKQGDKVTLELRIRKLTIIEIRIDFNKDLRLILFNMGVEFK